MIKTIPDSTIDAREIAKGTHNDLIEMENDISMSVIKEDSEYFSQELVSLDNQDDIKDDSDTEDE